VSTRTTTPRRPAALLGGLVSGGLWALVPLTVYGNVFSAFHAGWMLACGCLVGVALTWLLQRTGIGTTRRSRLLACVPVLLLAEGLWALLLTLPITREGRWPERGLELVAGIYWTNLFGLAALVLAPFAYWNIAWVMRSARIRAPR